MTSRLFLTASLCAAVAAASAEARAAGEQMVTRTQLSQGDERVVA